MIPKDKYDALYPFGSRVYGTNRYNSDWDYVAILKGTNDGEIQQGLINVKIISPEHFQEMINRHSVTALESIFLPSDKVITLPSKDWEFSLDKTKLRSSFSQKSNHAWVKAKKKFESPYDWAFAERERGKKSLFHSMRILIFGTQIATTGKIEDYGAANHIFQEIMKEESIHWQIYYDRWKPEYNQLATEFRKVAPK